MDASASALSELNIDVVLGSGEGAAEISGVSGVAARVEQLALDHHDETDALIDTEKGEHWYFTRSSALLLLLLPQLV